MKFMKLGSKPDTFQANDSNVRFVVTDLATDIAIHIGDVEFHMHKFPLLSKCAQLQKLLTTSNDENVDEIHISDIPGGPAAFEICAKFCYGMVVTLNAYNVIAARCAAEYLEMHESVEKGNLIYKIEVFLGTSIFRGWKDSIIVLQTTKSLLPWSEDLKLVSHCIDSIASKASIDPSKVEWSYTYNRTKLSSENGHDQWNGVKKEQSVPKDWWVEDLCDLDTDFYKRIIIAIKSKGRVSSNVIGEALKAYSYRMLSSIYSKGSKKSEGDVMKHQSLLQTIIQLLPAEKGSVSCSFLLKLLRAAIILDCGETAKKDLINRAGQQLEDASVSDLLIPTTTDEGTDYDIDIVSNIMEEFMIWYQSSSQLDDKEMEGPHGMKSPFLNSGNTKLAVAKLVDGYLAEIAKDPKLPLSKFIDLAAMVSTDSRPVHDGLYRAIDMFLKEHPMLSKGEKKKLCSLMDCKKLSTDACMHAVQNERLPLRVVVQVLFFEQMRAAAATTSRAESGGSYGSSRSVITTNTEDDSDGVPTVEDHNSMQQSVKATRAAAARNDTGNGGADIRSNDKVKVVSPGKKKMLGKLLQAKVQVGDNVSTSDTASESPDSANQEVPKCTPSRIMRSS